MSNYEAPSNEVQPEAPNNQLPENVINFSTHARRLGRIASSGNSSLETPAPDPADITPETEAAQRQALDEMLNPSPQNPLLTDEPLTLTLFEKKQRQRDVAQTRQQKAIKDLEKLHGVVRKPGNYTLNEEPAIDLFTREPIVSTPSEETVQKQKHQPFRSRFGFGKKSQ